MIFFRFTELIFLPFYILSLPELNDMSLNTAVEYWGEEFPFEHSWTRASPFSSALLSVKANTKCTCKYVYWYLINKILSLLVSLRYKEGSKYCRKNTSLMAVCEFVDCNDYYLYISFNKLQQKAFHSIYMYIHFSLNFLNQHYLYHHYWLKVLIRKSHSPFNRTNQTIGKS